MAPVRGDDPRRRTLEAADLVARHYGVEQQAVELEQATAGEWEPLAVAMLAEAMAAFMVEHPAPGARGRG